MSIFSFISENDASLSNADILNWFENDEIASKNSSVQKAVAEMRLLLDYCDLYGTESLIVIEPSLARGLDYYTGAIFEVVLKGMHVCIRAVKAMNS